MQFLVNYSEDLDLKAYLWGLWKPIRPDYGRTHLEIAQKYFPSDFLEELTKAKEKDIASQIIKNYWHQIRNKYFDISTETIIKWHGKFLNEEQNTIFYSLEKVYSQPFPFQKINVYLTTFFSCMYDYDRRWYMVNRDTNLMGLLNTSIHELNHFMFYFYFSDYLKQKTVSFHHSELIKEAFAVLTSNNPKENLDKPKVIPIQELVKNNNGKPLSQIIDLVIDSGLLQ
jgi:hypothetical protein